MVSPAVGLVLPILRPLRCVPHEANATRREAFAPVELTTFLLEAHKAVAKLTGGAESLAAQKAVADLVRLAKHHHMCPAP